MMTTLNKNLAMSLSYRAELHHKTWKNADGTPVRCRVNGKLKTWKTRPLQFQLPVKHGLRDCFYITEKNCSEWEIETTIGERWQTLLTFIHGMKKRLEHCDSEETADEINKLVQETAEKNKMETRALMMLCDPTEFIPLGDKVEVWINTESLYLQLRTTKPKLMEESDREYQDPNNAVSLDGTVTGFDSDGKEYTVPVSTVFNIIFIPLASEVVLHVIPCAKCDNKNQKVVGSKIVNRQFDATEVYTLECGHTTM